jgi:hypothetical protein
MDSPVLHRTGGDVRCGDVKRLVSAVVVLAAFAALSKGRSWSRMGVTCRHNNGLRCHNRDGHGFVLHRTSYQRF